MSTRRIVTIPIGPAVLLALIGVVLIVYLTFGLYTELRLIVSKPLPATLLEDFAHYERALADAQQGIGAYAVRQIGPGYLYPPPSLFLIEVFQFTRSAALKAAVYWAFNIGLLALTVIGIVRRFGGSDAIAAYWLALSLAAAPFLELLHIGQINVITMFGIALVFLYQDRSAMVSGAGLALAVLTKLSPIVVFAYLIITRRFRAAAIALFIVIGALVLSEARYPGSMIEYARTVQWLTDRFPLGRNSHSLVSKLHAIGTSLQYNQAWQPLAQTLMNKHLTQLVFNVLPIALITGLSLGLALWKRAAPEASFIILTTGMALAPNVMWYHHYVFLILPMLAWLGWRRFDWRVATWCTLGLLIVQLDRFDLTHGLLTHAFGRLTMLFVLRDQIKALSPQTPRDPCSVTPTPAPPIL